MKRKLWRIDPKTISTSGFVLVVVLWLLVLLSMIALHLALITRTEAKLSFNLVNSARLTYASDAGINWAIWNLSRDLDQRWIADGSKYTLPINDVTVEVALQDENGKFDLNLSELQQLERLMLAAGVDAATSNYLASAIIDWRDPDSFRQLNGAEDEDYLAAGLAYEAADAPFESVAELQKVLGMKRWIYQAIRSSLTVYTKRGHINPKVATRLVLLSYPNATEEAVDQYIKQRRTNHELGLPLPEPPAFISKYISPTLQGVYYTIHTEASSGEGYRGFQETVIRRRGGLQGRYEVIDIRVPITTEVQQIEE